ncbi:major facilitator superfamily domain-containing protein [Syncephalis fuscata]|nr:major facilitator superfamily domain-containing protein [Syncephalis fuscata]
MSRSLMSLVWLAGPLSGLIMQPLVGALSDRCTSRFGRRRPFMLGGSLVVVFSLLLIGWAKEIASILTFGYYEPATLSIVVAVFAFYMVDFAINTVQASIRALIVDVLPAEKQERGNAWAGGMIGVGSVCGYFLGMIDLVSTFHGFGNTQMKVLCAIASFALLLTVGITCFTIHERSFDAPSISVTTTVITQSSFNPWQTCVNVFQQSTSITRQLLRTMRQLPPSIQRICNVQFFAWVGWFPFLFYATTWVGELAGNGNLTSEQADKDQVGEATRTGSFAFLLYSIVSFVTACILPITIATGSNRWQRASSTSSYARKSLTNSLLDYIERWFNLNRIYTLAHLIFGGSMIATILTDAVWFATLLISICGISWAIMMWAPFALIGEIVNSDADRCHHHHKQYSWDQVPEYYPLANPQSTEQSEGGHQDAMIVGISPSNNHEEDEEDNNNSLNIIEDDDVIGPTLNGRRLSDCAGEILGIHNVYVVIPQFISTFTSSILFALFDTFTTANSHGSEGDTGETIHSPMAIGWILRLGGISVLFAAYLSTKIKPGTAT